MSNPRDPRMFQNRGPYGAEGQLPPNFPGAVNASLKMTTNQALAAQGIPFVATSCFFPTPILPMAPGLIHQTRRRVSSITGLAASGSYTLSWRFDKPTVVYGLTGACVSTAEAQPDGSSLDWFRINFTHNASSEKLDSDPVLGSAVLGIGREPAPVGLNGWRFDNGGVLEAPVTARFADLEIDVVAWVIEYVGPNNF